MTFALEDDLITHCITVRHAWLLSPLSANRRATGLC
jgi:hypothetical protein